MSKLGPRIHHSQLVTLIRYEKKPSLIKLRETEVYILSGHVTV